ncbi:MAG: hypothetical protein A2Z16_01795 [Chloroflexi bacterium RBG_16_54_18]|nr:MAG: hypothetical protein A2Z16_01795 [Chloroflexi bacterium RBG_16_54_18]
MTVSSYARRYLVRFEPLGRSVSVSPGTTLLDAAQLAGIGLPSTCHGQGDCCECKVEIIAGTVSRLTDLEEICFTESNLVANYRLACCTRILGGVQVLVSDGSGLTR